MHQSTRVSSLIFRKSLLFAVKLKQINVLFMGKFSIGFEKKKIVIFTLRATETWERHKTEKKKLKLLNHQIVKTVCCSIQPKQSHSCCLMSLLHAPKSLINVFKLNLKWESEVLKTWGQLGGETLKSCLFYSPVKKHRLAFTHSTNKMIVMMMMCTCWLLNEGKS